jgi:hypothetical protein
MALIMDTRVKIPVAPLEFGALTSLDMKLILQEVSNWCWAACMQMTLMFDDPASTKRQCEFANSAFNLGSSCENPTSTMCNKPLPIFQVAAEWSKLGYNSSFSVTALTFDEIKKEIGDNGRPVECGLLWTKGGGHAVLIVGFFEEGDNQWVDINDPTFKFRRITFDELLQAYGLGKWVKSWTGIRREH